MKCSHCLTFAINHWRRNLLDILHLGYRRMFSLLTHWVRQKGHWWQERDSKEAEISTASHTYRLDKTGSLVSGAESTPSTVGFSLICGGVALDAVVYPRFREYRFYPMQISNQISNESFNNYHPNFTGNVWGWEGDSVKHLWRLLSSQPRCKTKLWGIDRESDHSYTIRTYLKLRNLHGIVFFLTGESECISGSA